MKKLSLYRLASLMLALFALSACSNDDEFPTFRFDEDGTCYAPSLRTISKAEFESSVVGSGWKYVSTYEIGTDGECLRKEYYKDLIGAGPSYYYFETTDTLKEYYYMDALPAWGYVTRKYDYTDANRVAVNNRMKLQLISVEGDILKMVEYLGVRAGSEQSVYGYSTYKRMTEKELRDCQKEYHTDFLNIHDLVLSIDEKKEQIIIEGTEFEFDILDSHGECTVTTLDLREGACTISKEGNHVKVTLKKNGAYITVSDELQHRAFWLFSTDESLEPNGSTDIYDFTYTKLILNADKQLVDTTGHVLYYEYSSMGTTARDEYYGSILSKYNPSALLVVDENKQARFFYLNGGDIYVKELLPQETLDALAASGAGAELNYKLELVNTLGSVFQILPFKVVYKP